MGLKDQRAQGNLILNYLLKFSNAQCKAHLT